MTLCSRIFAVLCLLQCGCMSSDDAGKPPSDTKPAARLVIEGKPEVALLPSQVRTLQVRYLGADGLPVAGRNVEFGLSDTLSGASLSPAQVPTDEGGYAQADLRAGTSKATFKVRASAEGVEPVSFEISVGDAVALTASVKVLYPGARNIVSLSVTLVPDMDCAAVARMGPGPNVDSHFVDNLNGSVEFVLDAGQAYAFVAWGKDDTNAKLASGCTEHTAPPVTADEDDASFLVEIPIEDVPLEVAGSYAVALSLDLEAPLANLAQAAANAVTVALPTTATRAASFYLDAVQAGMASQDADELRALRAATSSPTLDQALEALLNGNQSGPLRYASELSRLVAAMGPDCTVQASYVAPGAAGAASFSVARLFALPDTSLGAMAKDVVLGAGQLTGTAALQAHYDDATAALVFESLSLQIGLGSYAGVLLDAAQADPQSFVSRLAPAHGCGSLANLVSARSLPGTPADAVASCERAVAGLNEGIRAAWRALDANYPSIWLSGALPVHDRDDDSVVDDLGPAELSGSWGSAASTAQGDRIGAVLRFPAPTALAL
jgi:hypothetical protein